MNKKVLFASAAAVLAISSCTNDDILSDVQQKVPSKYASELVTVGPDFSIIGTKGEATASTRANIDREGEEASLSGNVSTLGKFIQGWKSTDNVGAAWIGKNYKKDAAGNVVVNSDFTSSLDGQVLSNYKFDIKEYGVDEENMAAVSVADDALTASKRYTAKFQTNNLRVFSGDYIVYSPYDDKLDEQGYITMYGVENIEQNAAKSVAHLDGNFINSIGWAPKLVKGCETAGAIASADDATYHSKFTTAPFNSKILSTVYATEDITKKIKRVVYYSADEDIILQNGVDANKAVAALREFAVSGAVTSSPYTDNYEPKTTTAIAVTFNPTITLAKTSRVAPDYKSEVYDNVGEKTYNKTDKDIVAATVAMPADIAALDIYVVNEDQKAAVINKGAQSWKMAGIKNYGVKVNNAAFNTYVAFDCTDFETAAVAAYNDNVLIDPLNPALGYIKWDFKVLRAFTYGAEGGHADVEIGNASISGSKITVANGSTLTIGKNTKFNNFVIDNHGTITIKNGANTEGLTINGDGVIILEDGAKLSGIVNGIGTPIHYNTIQVNANAKAAIATTTATVENIQLIDGNTQVSVSGNITVTDIVNIPSENTKFNVTGSGDVTVEGQVVNYGTVNLDGSATKMTITEGAEFIDKIGSHMGGYALKPANMIVNGEYIAEVNKQDLLEAALVQKNKVATRIRITGTASANKDYDLEGLDFTNVTTNKKMDLQVIDNPVKVYLLGTAEVAKVMIDAETGFGNNTDGVALTASAIDVTDVATIPGTSVITVTGDINIAGGANVTAREGSEITAANLINKGTIVFENNQTTTISGKITNEGTFTIKDALGAGKTTALVKCSDYELVTGGVWGTTNLPIVE